MFKHILLPTDGSRLSDKAVRHGLQLAKTLQAKVTALHVMSRYHIFASEPEMIEASRDEYRHAMAENAATVLRRVARAAAQAGVACETLQVYGDHPYEEILAAARKRDCDLVLMASHGRRGIKGLLLGSETQKVLTHGKIPVLVYR